MQGGVPAGHQGQGRGLGMAAEATQRTQLISPERAPSLQEDGSRVCDSDHCHSTPAGTCWNSSQAVTEGSLAFSASLHLVHTNPDL